MNLLKILPQLNDEDLRAISQWIGIFKVVNHDHFPPGIEVLQTINTPQDAALLDLDRVFEAAEVYRKYHKFKDHRPSVHFPTYQKLLAWKQGHKCS